MGCVQISFAQSSPDLLLDAYAPSEEELALWAEEFERLVQFDKAPEFINRELSDEDEKIRGELEVACTTKTFVDCQAYIRANRQRVLMALPDNSRYWELFWEVLRAPNLLDLSRPADELAIGQQRLMQSTYWWFYRDLAQDGRVEIEHAVVLQSAVRRWRAGHQTLIGRMITIAMQHIAFDQMSFAMAQTSRDRELRQLDEITRATRPIYVSDMSWGPLLWVEREWSIGASLASWEAPTEIDIQTALIESAGAIDEATLRSMFEDPAPFWRGGSDLLARHYLPVSTVPWGTYWSDGLPPIDEEKFSENPLTLIIAPSYDSYLTTDRAAHFRVILFPALADIYAGRVSPGMPARPAPPHWRWAWQTGDQPELCLVGDDIHPSVRLMPDQPAERWCVDYYDEASVERLYLQ